MKKVRKWITLWLVAAIVALNLLVLTPTAVYACSCAVAPSATIELRRSTAVFVGKVTDVQWDLMTARITFDVSEVWKGSVQKVQTVHTSRDEASCGFDFMVGKKYLVYANGSAANLEVNLCSRTMLLATAVTDLTTLGTGTLPSVVAPVQWLPTIFFTLLGLFLILSGLFKPQIDRRLGFGEHSRLFTNPHFQQSARKTAFIGRTVLVLLGISLTLQGIGNGYFAYTVLNLLAILFLTLAVIGLFFIIGTTLYFGWIK